MIDLSDPSWEGPETLRHTASIMSRATTAYRRNPTASVPKRAISVKIPAFSAAAVAMKTVRSLFRSARSAACPPMTPEMSPTPLIRPTSTPESFASSVSASRSMLAAICMLELISRKVVPAYHFR